MKQGLGHGLMHEAGICLLNKDKKKTHYCYEMSFFGSHINIVSYIATLDKTLCCNNAAFMILFIDRNIYVYALFHD